MNSVSIMVPHFSAPCIKAGNRNSILTSMTQKTVKHIFKIRLTFDIWFSMRLAGLFFLTPPCGHFLLGSNSRSFRLLINKVQIIRFFLVCGENTNDPWPTLVHNPTVENLHHYIHYYKTRCKGDWEMSNTCKYTFPELIYLWSAVTELTHRGMTTGRHRNYTL